MASVVVVLGFLAMITDFSCCCCCVKNNKERDCLVA